MKNTKDTCIDVYKNLNVQADTGDLKISTCCLIKTEQFDTVDFVENKKLDELRKQWDLGIWPTDCNSCKQAELNGTTSRRQGLNQWYKEHNLYNTKIELVRLDYWTGDHCNLRCAICSSAYSSAWARELGMVSKKSTINYFWKTLDLAEIRYIHFNGGEPLLSKEHVVFLEALTNKSNISLNYNTNATIRPSQKLLDIWGQFKLVMLDFSIDDIGERFEYQRYPARWQDVVENLQWFKDVSPANTMFGINATVSILNNANIANLEKWVRENFSENRLGDPVELKMQPAMGKLSLSNPQGVRAYLDSLDSRRGTNWKVTFPELVNLNK